MVYGDALPRFTYHYTGFVNGDNLSSLATQPIASSTASATSGVGTYTITAAGAVDADYKFVYVPGTLTVIRAVPKLNVSGGGYYTGAPMAVAEQAIGVDGLTLVNGTWTTVYYSRATLTGAPLAGRATNPGVYSVSAVFHSSDPNYLNASTTLTFSILQPKLNIVLGGYIYNRFTRHVTQTLTITNTSGVTIKGPVSLALDGVNVTLANSSGTTTSASGAAGSPYINLNFGASNTLAPNQSLTITLDFYDPSLGAISNYCIRLLAGTGIR